MRVSNLIGPIFKSKIIILESDDWGSDRFVSREVRDKYIPSSQSNICWMSYVDTFENDEDVSNLIGLLTDNGNVPFTMLFNPVNPDFNAIKESEFENYYYIDFVERSLRSESTKNLLGIYNEGIKTGILELAFHGREHLNVQRWLKDLKSGDEIALKGFNDGFWGFSKSYTPDLKHSYRSTFAADSNNYFEFQKDSIEDGIRIMNEIFSTDVKYFIAPDGPFSFLLLEPLEKMGIKYIGLPRLFRDELTKYKRISWLNRKVGDDIHVITRNATFEPASPRKNDWVNSCLFDIDSAFKSRKPAVISTHRANYVGGLNKINRDKGLAKLDELLKQIVKKWPDAIFLTSSQLGDLMNK